MPTSGQIKQLLCRAGVGHHFIASLSDPGPTCPRHFRCFWCLNGSPVDSATATWPLRLTVQSIRAWRVSIPYLRR